MPQYLLLIYGDPAAEGRPADGSPEQMADFPKWMALNEEMGQAGALRGGNMLQPVTTATTVRRRNGERVLSDGPFAETKELLGGYYVVEAADLDAAIAWAEKIPTIHWASIEVRPVLDVGAPSE